MKLATVTLQLPSWIILVIEGGASGMKNRIEKVSTILKDSNLITAARKEKNHS